MWGGLTPNERNALHTTHAKANAYKPHGTWMRYRQGCTCSDCVDAHNKPTDPINVSVLPKWEEPIDDLEMLRFNLLSTQNPVD